MATTNYFYSDETTIGIVVDSASGNDTDGVTPISTVATLKLYGRFQQSDLSAATDTPSLINARYHIAIAYKVLEQLDEKRARMWGAKYLQMVRAIKWNQNPLNAKRRMRQYHF